MERKSYSEEESLGSSD